MHEQHAAVGYRDPQSCDAKNKLPSGGEGTRWDEGNIGTGFDINSTFTQLLPYLEEKTVADLYNYKFAYDDKDHPSNQQAAKAKIATFRCPSNSMFQVDPADYGTSDYMPTVYTDISPVTGVRDASTATDRHSRADGALASFPVSISKITDGTSKTIAISEDCGRNFETLFPNTKSKYPDIANIVDDAKTPSGNRESIVGRNRHRERSVRAAQRRGRSTERRDQ